ncbi:MAG TPA: mercuric transport protein MerTP [Bacteroidia bacterium]|nr:mercuric transport protein MerTP [Bacteroidia bacterium]
MKNKSNSGKLAGASILSAIAASLCCITPILALISGAGGIASSFTWLEPARPYLLGITVLVLGFAWYQKLKPSTAEDIQCDCEEDGKQPFMQTKKFLGIVTVFAFLMMAFPYYGHVFYPKANKKVIVVSSNHIQKATFDISGMGCTDCEREINYQVNNLSGVLNIKTSYENRNAIVEFDSTKTSITEIKKAINATGYKVTGEVAKANTAQGETGHLCSPNGCGGTK